MKDQGVSILILIMLAGVILQIALLFLVMEPDEVKRFDPQDYVRIGRQLASGEPFSTRECERNLYFSPGYPYLLAAMIKIAGPEVINIRIFHILLFPFFLFFLYRLGKDWKNEAVGLILAALAVIYPFYIYVPLTLYPEAALLYIVPFIIWLMLYNGKKSHWLTLLLSSAVIALAVMIKPTMIFIIPVFVFYITLKPGWKFKHFLTVSGLICMLPVLAALGWMWRNNAVHGKPVFSTASGLNLLLSFNENASINHKFDYPLPERILKRLQNADSKEEYETIARDEAFGFIKSNPGKAARLTIFKQLDLWNPFSHASRGGFAQKEFKLLAAIPYIFFLTLGIIGFFKNRNSDFVIALLFLTLLNCLLNGIIAGSVRYRIITDFAFLLLAADMITRFWMYLRIKKHFPAK